MTPYTQTTPHRTMRELAFEDRPLHRLNQHGAGILATAELLALLLGTAEAPGLAADLLTHFGSLHQLARASKAQLMKIRGIGEGQAARLLALLELSCRLQAPPAEERHTVTCPADAANLLMPHMRHLQQEELRVILLSTRNQVLGMPTIYRGSLNSSLLRLAEVFRPAIEAPAAAVILAHNHPTGDPSPSPEDIRVTRQAVQTGKLLDIELLDHLIVGNGHYTSLKERQLGFD